MQSTGQVSDLEKVEPIAKQIFQLMRAIKDVHSCIGSGGTPTLERSAYSLLHLVGEHGPARPSMLAERLGVDLSTVSRQLASLENAGWIQRDRDLVDRRASLVRVTPEGVEVLRRNHTVRLNVLADAVSDWSDEDRESLIRHLTRFNNDLAERRQRASNALADQVQEKE